MAVGPKRIEHFQKNQHPEPEIKTYVSFTSKQSYVESCAYVDAGAEWIVTTVYK